MLSIEHVTKKYGAFTALEDLNLVFENGLYGLLAPNGAGKTTLIKMITTLLFPTEGSIRWNGRDILEMGEDYRGLIGYLPQEFGYYKNNSPRQFLRYMAALQRMERKAAERRIDELLELVALSEVKDRKMRQFSGGMIRRVGIAQAMLNDPKILILDEPTAGLDPKERVRFRSLIHGLSENRIVLLSTHIVSDIETVAGQIVMLRDHQLFCCDSPANICGLLKGRLFEVPAGTMAADGTVGTGTPAAAGPFVVSEGQGERGPVLRVFSEIPPEHGRPVTPGLEDAFLYIYRDGEQ